MLKRDVVLFCETSTRLDAQRWIQFFNAFNERVEHDLSYSTLAAKLQDLFIQDDQVYNAMSKFDSSARRSIAEVQRIVKEETKLKARLKGIVKKTTERSRELSSTSLMALGSSSHRDVSNDTCMSSVMGGETEVLDTSLILVVICMENAETILNKKLKGHEYDRAALYFNDQDNREAYMQMSDSDRFGKLLDLYSLEPSCFKVRAGAK